MIERNDKRRTKKVYAYWSIPKDVHSVKIMSEEVVGRKFHELLSRCFVGHHSTEGLVRMTCKQIETVKGCLFMTSYDASLCHILDNYIIRIHNNVYAIVV